MFERTFSGALGPYFSQIKEIAAGGNGRVFSAIDTRYGFAVCMKKIPVSNKDECRSALRELRIRRRLKHENIVGLLNAIVDDGTDVCEINSAIFRDTTFIYFVQELLDADLRQVIESNPRLSPDYVKLIFYQLLRGLKYIHSANVLHRDLKPSNVMINVNSLQIKIGDFGHSLVFDPEYIHGNKSTVSDTSQWYKAPELILGAGQYSRASDIWAAGCIFAEMMLGRPLFEAECELDQLELIIHAIQVSPDEESLVRSFLTKEVNAMYTGVPKFPLKSKFSNVDCQAIHLLQNLLSFNPSDRVSTELALSHPFLADYACPADEPVCLKPLHLEHEVDDFLECTLKDLIVGECVAFSEEQPVIRHVISTCSSINELKEENVSPVESGPPSTLGSMCDSKPNCVDAFQETCDESKDCRFKVLEVLREEHGSSSDSNGIATHEEGVSEAPLVLDHRMFSSSKWEKERHKSVHRRHHHHRRKKKHHLKSPTVETDTCMLKNIHEFEICKENNVNDSVPCTSEGGNSLSSSETHNDTVHANADGESNKIQDPTLAMFQVITANSLPSITDVCCNSLSPWSSINCVSCTLSSEQKLYHECVHHSVNDERDVVSDVTHDQVRENENESKVETTPSPSFDDLGVADVIQRSQELLGDFCICNSTSEKDAASNRKLQRDFNKNRAEHLIKESEELLNYGIKNECRHEQSNDRFNVTNGSLKSEEISFTQISQYSAFTKTLTVSCDSSLCSSVIGEHHDIEVDQGSDYTTSVMHLKDTDRRLQQLFQESHDMLEGHKEGLVSENLSKDEAKVRKAEQDIDFDEMKIVHYQAKRLLEEANKSTGSNQEDFCERNKKDLDIDSVNATMDRDIAGREAQTHKEVVVVTSLKDLPNPYSSLLNQPSFLNLSCGSFHKTLEFQNSKTKDNDVVDVCVEQLMDKNDAIFNRGLDRNTECLNGRSFISCLDGMSSNYSKELRSIKDGTLLASNVYKKLFDHQSAIMCDKNAKKNTRAQHFYDNLKFKAIIHHRTHREKRYDTYPF